MNGDRPTYALLPAQRPIPDVAPKGQLQVVDSCDLSEYPTTRVPVTDLVLSNWLRVKGEDIKHVRALAEVEDELPPIVVHRATMQVIDGMHRVRAAILSGVAYIEALLFEGAEDEAFLLAVRLNVTHGLPLSRADRVAAAVRIIHSSPQWSDRVIARAAGLSDKTVASIRRRATAEIPHLPDRIGRDGRVRPVSPAAGRRMASDLIAKNPDAAISEIATRAGISLGTARDVRERLRNGLDPVPLRHRDTSGSQPRGEDDRTRQRSLSARMIPVILESLRNDPALRYNETGRALLRLLALHTMSPADWEQLISAVPLHRAQAVAQVARSCSEAWQEFATRLEYVAQQHSISSSGLPRLTGASSPRSSAIASTSATRSST